MARTLVTANALHRTFCISFKDKVGTCFTIDVSGKQYIITARHIVDGIKHNDRISIRFKGTWSEFGVELVGEDADTDTAVLAPDQLISVLHPLPASISGLAVSQEVYFLGYPYALSSNIEILNYSFPLPFVKTAIVSAFEVDASRVKIIFLDGYNNPGFSGGPVVFAAPGHQDLKVAGVVSGFRWEWERVFAEEIESSLKYRQNTGIVIAYSIDYALALIEKNPVGYPMEKLG